MDDRFRFRAWHKLNKQYYYDAEQTYDYLLGNPPILENNFGELLRNDDYIIEQCSGSKDMNGKLIYEGDIVKFYEHNYEVYFNTNAGGFSIWNEKKEVGYSLYYHEELKVIGNIHENPDLLKGE